MRSGTPVVPATLAIATTLPLDAHLAAHVDVQGSVLLAAVLAFLMAVARQRHAAALGWFTLAALVDWPAFYLPPLLALAPWPFATPRPRRFVIVLVAYAAQPDQKLLRRHVEAALALDRLDDDGRHMRCLDICPEQPFDGVHRIVDRGSLVRDGVGHVPDPCGERAELRLVGQNLAR